jgi:hypothetical protein
MPLTTPIKLEGTRTLPYLNLLARRDFSKAKKHVEVKTTVGTTRIHHFSHRQIWEAEGEMITIASLMLAEDDSGLS